LANRCGRGTDLRVAGAAHSALPCPANCVCMPPVGP
jgi:hypothetical protein